MFRNVCLISLLMKAAALAATLYAEDFSAVSNPSNVTGTLPIDQWHMDGSTEWQGEGWSGTAAAASVSIVDGSNLMSALQLGWRADNVEVRYVLSDTWDIRRDYELSGEWEKIDDSAGNHLGFHVYLSEFAPTGWVRHVAHEHVDPGNPATGTTGVFSLAVPASELIDVHVNTSNHIGIVFVRSEDADLQDEIKAPSEYAVKNDMFAVDKLVLTESDTLSPDLAGVIMQPIYLSESGNNGNSGLSPAQALRNVNGLDGLTFGPGAEILFNRGDTFAGACTLSGSGTAEDPIFVGTYGSGEKPLLTGWFNKKEIFRLTDNEGIEFHDLHISNFNTENAIKSRYGITLEPPENSGDLHHLRFMNLDFFDIQGSGGFVDPDKEHRSIAIYGQMDGNDDAAVPSRWNDLLIEQCTFSDIDGLGAQINDTCLDITDVKVRGYTNYFPTVGLVFQHNVGTNCYRNLLQIRGTKDALIQYNTMDTTVEGSAFWPFGTDGTLVQFNIFRHLRADDADSYVCHFDYNCIGTVMQYNYGYDVEGGLIELLVNSQNPAYFQEEAIARYNIGIDVGWRNKPNGAGIFITGSVDGAQVYNNTLIQLNRPMTHGISFNNWGGSWPINNVLYNNLFYAAGTNTVSYNSPARFDDAGNVVSHNLFHGNISPPGSAVNSLSGDPVFVNAAGTAPKDFKVQYGSPAIAAGLPVTANGERDYFGYAVSNGVPPTVGFHEQAFDPNIDSDGDAMFDLWESGYDLNPGSAADAAMDADGDLLDNLYEFGVGGDPTNAASLGYASTYGLADADGTTRFAYIHPRRSDAAEIGLDYTLGVSSNLTEGGWVNWAHWISGVGPEAFGPGFDAVTNYLSLDNTFTERFIRLELD